MRRLLLFAFMLVACPLAFWLGWAAAPPPPPAAAEPSVMLSADSPRVRVGDTLTLTGVPVNIGLPYYTLTLSSGAALTITYAGEVTPPGVDGALARDSIFEIVSAQAALNRVSVVLRALAPGSVEAVISATGEVRTPEGAFTWSGGASQPLLLTVEN